jgi:uncharacterized protein
MKKFENTQAFSLLIKPASADCNLRCAYCFYLEKAALYPSCASHRMTDKVLETLIGTYMRTRQPQYAFAWQGGEPTLMGEAFFHRVTELQTKHGFSGASVANHLQTNAVLMTGKLAEHLARYNFLVGVSLDGPAYIHDCFRKFSNGIGSHAKVVQGIRVLRRHSVETNILTLVTSCNASKGREVYEYLVDEGFFYHQYIPCVEFDRNGQLLPYSLSPEAWGEFLCTIFDYWSADPAKRVSVRYFDALLQFLVNGERTICHMGRKCNNYFLVEYNGDVYPCDFFAEKALRLGNVQNDSWQKLLNVSPFVAFANDKSRLPEDCCQCAYHHLCSGDCLKHRLQYGTKSPLQKSWLCSGYKMFFNHALPKLTSIAEKIRQRINSPIISGDSKEAVQKVGRNQLCPCGSGFKYKRCCGR